MVSYWIFSSSNIANSIKCGIVGEWTLAWRTVERGNIDIRYGDKVILYQPYEVRGERRLVGGKNYIGSFTIDSDPFIKERRGEEELYTMKIRDFKLWEIFVSKEEVEDELDTEIPRGRELGRLIKTQVVIPISREDYEKIVERYAEKVEDSISE